MTSCKLHAPQWNSNGISNLWSLRIKFKLFGPHHFPFPATKSFEPAPGMWLGTRRSSQIANKILLAMESDPILILSGPKSLSRAPQTSWPIIWALEQRKRDKCFRRASCSRSRSPLRIQAGPRRGTLTPRASKLLPYCHRCVGCTLHSREVSLSLSQVARRERRATPMRHEDLPPPREARRCLPLRKKGETRTTSTPAKCL